MQESQADKELLRQWRQWNGEGFIPGPYEKESLFQERIVFCLNLEQELLQKEDFPFGATDPPSQEILNEALPLTQKLYGIQPHWVPLFFSNDQMFPWHAGCAWIFQRDAQTPTAAFLQLRLPFRHSSSFLRIYQRRELIAHELAHVGRMLYHEPQFEEILAYQSSSSRWRRWLGPIVQSSGESLFFVSLLALLILTHLALLFFPERVSIAWWTELLPFLLIAFALGRVTYRWQVLTRCLGHLAALYSSPDEARHLLYRLRDSEIRQFSRSSPLKIQTLIEEAAKKSFRWRFLSALYPISIDRFKPSASHHNTYSNH